MATTKIYGTATTASGAIDAMNVTMNGVTINNAYAQGVIKVGSGQYEYYFIYN